MREGLVGVEEEGDLFDALWFLASKDKGVRRPGLIFLLPRKWRGWPFLFCRDGSSVLFGQVSRRRPREKRSNGHKGGGFSFILGGRCREDESLGFFMFWAAAGSLREMEGEGKAARGGRKIKREGGWLDFVLEEKGRLWVREGGKLVREKEALVFFKGKGR